MSRRGTVGLGLGACFIVIVLAIAIDAALAAVLAWAWGMVAVPLFRLPPLSYWQAVAILIGLWIIGGFFKSTTNTAK